MKTFIVILFTATTFSFSGCRKKDETLPINDNLVGEWAWTSSTGGLATHTVTPTNNVVHLTFNSDSTYIYSENGIIKSSDNYTIKYDPTYGHYIQLVNFNAGYLWLEPNGEISKIQNNQLTLVDYMVSDGFTHYFQRYK